MKTMTTKSIEERAHNHAEKWRNEEYYSVDEAIEAALTEQDRIARAEERERCIRIACDYYCDDCDGCIYKKENKEKCRRLELLRKAIEEGGEE